MLVHKAQRELLWWPAQASDVRFDAWVRRIPWRRKWQPTPGFLPGKSHGQRSLVDYSPWGSQKVGQDLATKITTAAKHKEVTAGPDIQTVGWRRQHWLDSDRGVGV